MVGYTLAWRMSGLQPEKKPNGSWLYPRSKGVLDAAGLHTIAHYMDVRRRKFYRQSTDLGTLCGSSEKEGFADPTVLVGSANGFGIGKGEGPLAPLTAGRSCFCRGR